MSHSPRPYLFALVTSVVLAKVAQYLWQYVWPSIPLVKGQAPGIYVMAVGFAISATLWLVFRGKRTSNSWTLVLLGLLALVWLTHTANGRAHGDSVAYIVLLTPLVLLALWLKTPTARDLQASVAFLGWLLALILVLARTLEMLGVIPVVNVGDWLVDFERHNYWLPLSGWLGPEGRWPGPMGHNAQTGNVAAMLVVLGVGLRGRWRWGLVSVGGIALLLTSSKTSYLGALVGVLALMLFDDNPLTRRIPRKWLVTGLGIAGALGVLVVLVQNPNLTGRTNYWAAAVEAWQASPLTGVGANALASPELQQLGTNAHNIFIDAALKYGILGLLPVLLLTAFAVVVTGRSLKRQLAVPFALVATYLVIGLAEADQGWLTPSIMWLWFVLPTLWATLAQNDPVDPELAGA